jgi:hypothetical protein
MLPQRLDAKRGISISTQVNCPRCNFVRIQRNLIKDLIKASYFVA